LESLYDVGLSIAGTLDLESLADDVLMKSVSLLNAQSGTLILRDAAGEGSVLVKNIGGKLVREDHGEILFPEDEVLVLNERGLRPGDDPSDRAAARQRARARGREPPDAAGRRRLLQRLSARRRPHGVLRGRRLRQGSARGAPRVDGPRLPPPARRGARGRPRG